MQPEERNFTYLWDMREAANDIHLFVKGISFEKFNRNKMIRFAIERQLLVIGEAANHVSESYMETHPEIPWRQLIGQRNVLAHQYGDILAERVWETATSNIPDLIKALKKILGKESHSEAP